MRTRVERQLREETERFVFRFACDDCAHVDLPGRRGGIGQGEAIADPDARCSLGYPAAPRRSALPSEVPGEGTPERHLELCKAFELG